LQLIFAFARVTLTVVFLLYASWSDYKTREVSNRVWAFYAPIALALSLAEFLLYNQAIFPIFALSAGLNNVFALLLFYTGGFGGADSKALMCIALALPVFPIVLLTPVLPDGLSPLSKTIFPVTILTNAVLIAALSGLYLLLNNLIKRKTTKQKLFEGTLKKASFGKKILVLITGRKYSIATLKAKWHIYPMEDIEEENSENGVKRKLVVVPKDEGRTAILERLSKAIDAGKISDGVWATPGLPMLIFVTVGLLIALVFGDIVWILVTHLMG
jgi:preflagellin peptidase FlaK